MDRNDLLLTIGNTTTFLRIYTEEILELNPEGINNDESLKKAIRDLVEQTNVLLLPGGTPCARCNGSGVEP